MFLMISVNQGRKEFDFIQTEICDACGAFGRYQVFMIYSVLSLFFIPCFKWGKRYYVQTSCCGTLYELDPEVGKRIARGEDVKIRPESLRMAQRGFRRGMGRRCSNCGYETEENFEYCPICGRRF